MENSVEVATPQSDILPNDKPNISAMLESRKCPLCNSTIRLFFVNYNEKLLMCENERCEYPFGYEEPQLFTVDANGQLEIEDEASSVHSQESLPVTGSMISTAAWSEIDKLVRCCEEDAAPETLINSAESSEKSIRDSEIKKNLEAITELNNQLHFENEKNDNNVMIRQNKWLRSLKTIQEVSGVKLLKPEEMRLLKKEEPNIGLGELRIDIGQGNDNDMSSIKIEICNTPARSRETRDPPV